MRIHWIQHVPFEGLGCIEEWAVSRGHDLASVRLWAGDDLPGTDEISFLVIMGGPMGVDDGEEFGWLASEKGLIAECVEKGSIVLGVCLGAQLIASVLGAGVGPNGCKEIGWYPVELSGAAADSPFAEAPLEFSAFHWHGDRFEIPPGAVHLASSAACRNQAFAVDNRVLGLQFHLEIRPAGIESLIEHCANELAGEPWIQPVDSMRAMSANCAEANALMDRVLDRLAGAVG